MDGDGLDQARDGCPLPNISFTPGKLAERESIKHHMNAFAALLVLFFAVPAFDQNDVSETRPGCGVGLFERSKEPRSLCLR
jgi:hypothetical protein